MRADWGKALAYEIWVGPSRRLQLHFWAPGFLVSIWATCENGALVLKSLNPLIIGRILYSTSLFLLIHAAPPFYIVSIIETSMQ